MERNVWFYKSVLFVILLSVFPILPDHLSFAMAVLPNTEAGRLESESASQEADKAEKVQAFKSYGNLPLSFIRNDGQVDEAVKFYEKGNGHTTFFTKEGVSLVLTASQPSASKVSKGEVSGEKPETTSELIRLIPLGANKDPEIVAEGKQEGIVNTFIGNDPALWKTRIPTYQAVLYKELYQDIDIRFYGNNRQFEYDVIVKPGADPAEVQFAYEGIENLSVTEEGALEITLKEGKLVQNKPYVYQQIKGKRVEVKGKFVLYPGSRSESAFVYGFEVASYNKNYPLVIDPVLVYSTYLGGSGNEEGRGIAVDDFGNAYITGWTTSTDFPTALPLQPGV